jgi:hypothetical protein
VPRSGPLPALPPIQTVRLISNSPRALTDFPTTGGLAPVVSAAFRSVLESFNRDIVWYPVELTHNGKVVEGEFWTMAVRPAFSFHNEQASHPMSLELLIDLCVDSTKVPKDVDVFTHFESSKYIYVRGHVLKELRRRKIKGIEASKLRVVNCDNAH